MLRKSNCRRSGSPQGHDGEPFEFGGGELGKVAELGWSQYTPDRGRGSMANKLVKVGNTAVPVVATRVLTPAQYGDLAEVPPELEWLANITNPKTRRAYKIDVEEFIDFAGLDRELSASLCEFQRS